jgi:hypothetical protein
MGEGVCEEEVAEFIVDAGLGNRQDGQQGRSRHEGRQPYNQHREAAPLRHPVKQSLRAPKES